MIILKVFAKSWISGTVVAAELWATSRIARGFFVRSSVQVVAQVNSILSTASVCGDELQNGLSLRCLAPRLAIHRHIAGSKVTIRTLWSYRSLFMMKTFKSDSKRFFVISVSNGRQFPCL